MITTSYLHDIAAYTDGNIAKVVLNGGAVVIEDFLLKDVSDGELTMQYMVPAGSVSDVTLIELQDSAGNVISTNAVSIPITADTILLQTILVKGAT